MLGAIGLDETHESAYRALVSAGPADVADLARRLTLGEHDTVRALRRLERHGLAAQSSGRPGRWVAAPPGVALVALLARQRYELERAELAAALLAEEYRAVGAEPAIRDLVEVVTGAAAVAQRFPQIQPGAGEAVCALVTGTPVAVNGGENGRDERIRVVDEVPTKLPSGLGVAGVAEQASDGPDAADLEILSLLLAGMTDASVAKQLDLGLRTVQRRVKGLMELAGVTTRLQLGWHAYERGWVTRERHRHASTTTSTGSSSGTETESETETG